MASRVWVGEDIGFGDTVGYERYYTVKTWLQEFTSKITNVIDFALDKLEWPVEYWLEKIFPLITLWDMRYYTVKAWLQEFTSKTTLCPR